MSASRVQKAEQELTYKFRLFLMNPMAAAIHHMNAFEFREAALSGLLGPADPAIGAPILFAGDDLRGNIDCATHECHHLVAGVRVKGAPIIV
jgi:hypothetical protein